MMQLNSRHKKSCVNKTAAEPIRPSRPGILKTTLFAGLAVATAMAAYSRDPDPISSDSVTAWTFEESSVPAGWESSPEGQLSISDRHSKHGDHSLMWEWKTHSVLRAVDLAELHTAGDSPDGGIKAWVYNETPVPGALIFRIGSRSGVKQGSARYSFRFGLNFSGWRAMWIHFREDASVPGYSGDDPLQAMEVTVSDNEKSGRLWFDLVKFTRGIPWLRSADWQVPFVNKARSNRTWQESCRWSKKTLTDQVPPAITDREKEAFATIAGRYETWVFGEDIDGDNELMKIRLNALRDYITNGLREFEGLKIQVRDGIIQGIPLFAGRSPYSPKFIDVFQKISLPLALDWRMNARKESRDKFLLLTDYLHDQGWAAGSGLGTQDHETLRSAGHMHAVYLMRKELAETERLDREMATLEWYTNFGEIYEKPSHPGTSADRARTILLYRIFRILCMPDTPVKAAKMKNLVRWINSALGIAPGWADTIKPDYTGFHHRGVYANAYAPHALHNAALVLFLLHDTPFALSDRAGHNLKQALLCARIMANKYEVPVGISGRMPFAAPILAKILPAYAYMALAGNPVDHEMASAFMRLWDPSCEELPEHLIRRVAARIMYLNSPGSLQLMLELAEETIAPEPAPEGNWSKPYAALQIHRRKSWMVSVKGWSQYAWNYEGRPGQNAFGRYSSFGAMQILAGGHPVSNAGSGYVEQGWDWNRWPGATTIYLPLEELGKEPKAGARHFTDETFVGGVTSGGMQGVFAMKLHDTVNNTSFRANKSFFFFDDLIVCLGSDIVNDNTNNPTETTIFQCSIPSPDTPISMNSSRKITVIPWEYKSETAPPVWLTDPQGNGYFIPQPDQLRISRKCQLSLDDSGRTETSGNFATAWLDHGTAPRQASYEYAVLVQPDMSTVAAFAENPRYQVLRLDRNAHIVRCDDLGITGYAVFEAGGEIGDGLLRSANVPCLVMMREEKDNVTVSLCDPDLRIHAEGVSSLRDITEENLYNPSRDSEVTIALHGKWLPVRKHTDVRVGSSSEKTTSLIFSCREASTVEIHLERP